MPDSDQLNTNVPLGIQAPAQQANPLSIISGLTDLQGKLNQNKLFQQTFAARQEMGNIAQQSVGPDGQVDIDKFITGITSNPLTAAFAGEQVNQLRQSQQALTAIGGQQQTQGQEFLGNLGKYIGASATRPDQLGPMLNGLLRTLSPQMQSKMGPGIESIVTSLTHDLPADPQAAQAEFMHRATPYIMLGPKELQDGVLGTSAMPNTGNALQPGVQKPAWAGGGFTPSGNALGIGAPPQYTKGPGDVPVAVPAISPGGGSGPSGPSPSSGPSPAGSTPPNITAGDGKPLFDPNVNMVAPSAGKGAAGLQLLSKPQLDMSSKLTEQYNDQGLKQFQNAQATMGSLQYMDNAFDNMVHGGGFLVPGALADTRVALAKFANTVAQVTGQDPAFDPTKVASAEDFVKETKRMGLMVINQMLGGQREAAQIITGITSSVPGISNTYMGGKLVSAGIQAATQRVIDERNFENQWQQQNQGNLTGATEAFNQAHPAASYANRVLSQFGMNENGFSTPTDIVKAAKSGYVTNTQAATLLHEHFPDQFAAPSGGQ